MPSYHQVTLEELREVAAKRNVKIPTKDEQDYLTLLRAADLAINHIDSLPPYIDPRLLPEAGGDQDGAKVRLFRKPPSGENPLNAWSHQVWLPPALCFTLVFPSSVLLTSATILF